jgi:hypothetical protein
MQRTGIFASSCPVVTGGCWHGEGLAGCTPNATVICTLKGATAQRSQLTSGDSAPGKMAGFSDYYWAQFVLFYAAFHIEWRLRAIRLRFWAFSPSQKLKSLITVRLTIQ